MELWPVCRAGRAGQDYSKSRGLEELVADPERVGVLDGY
jgi:hypothetical protein